MKTSQRFSHTVSNGREAGAAIVPLVLVTLLVLAGILYITANMSVSARRSTADQRVVLAAQYAADTGAARATARLNQFRSVVLNLKLTQTLTDTDLGNFLSAICGSGAAAFSSTATAEAPITTCVAGSSANLGGALTNTAYIDSTSLAAGYAAANVSTAEQNTFMTAIGGAGTGLSLASTLDSGSGLDRTLDATVRVKPLKVDQIGLRKFRVYLQTQAIDARGGASVTGAATRVVAQRAVNIGASTDNTDPASGDLAYAFDIGRDPYSQYLFFRDNTSATSGGALYLSGGESFEGPVHTNGNLNLSGNNNRTPPYPVFADKLTTASTSWNLSGLPASCAQPSMLAGSCTQMFTSQAPQIVPTIPLPTNSNNQIRAAYGAAPNLVGDVADPSTAELAGAWGVSNPMPGGVYYSSGSGSNANTGTSWKGGIYVNGAVDVLTLSKNQDGRQKITIKQGTMTTVFNQASAGSWTVSKNGNPPTTLSGSFNGMVYVNGDVKSLMGNGGVNADIASGTRLTLATSGNIRINDSLTYTDAPNNSDGTPSTATNVLGIYTSGGSVILDGPDNQDLNIDASIMATATGQGMGSLGTAPNGGGGTVVQYTAPNTKPKINLRGGLIEQQSQTISNSEGGYSRNYKYDKRFKNGYAPPFFPLQMAWNTEFTQEPKLGLWRQSR